MLSLPPATKMFQLAGFARSCLYIQQVVHLGFPISDTLGSLLVSSSPRHFVGHHVLLRLCVPRYPPLALCSLTSSAISSFYSLLLDYFVNFRSLREHSLAPFLKDTPSDIGDAGSRALVLIDLN